MKKSLQHCERHFYAQGELQILPNDVAKSLAEAAGMRNLLVHAYGKVDLKIIYESIKPALKDFSKFVEIMSQKNLLIPPDSSTLPPKDE